MSDHVVVGSSPCGIAVGPNSFGIEKIGSAAAAGARLRGVFLAALIAAAGRRLTRANLGGHTAHSGGMPIRAILAGGGIGSARSPRAALRDMAAVVDLGLWLDAAPGTLLFQYIMRIAVGKRDVCKPDA